MVSLKCLTTPSNPLTGCDVMTKPCLAEVTYFVQDCRKAAEWYALLFDEPVQTGQPPDLYVVAAAADVTICFHPADEKSPVGMAGQLVTWRVDGLTAVLDRVQRLGGQLYRGPFIRGDGLAACQVRDPFGNVFGLLGPV